MPVKSYKMGPGQLRLGETGTEVDYAAQVTACRITWAVERPDAVPVLSGEELRDDPTWSATLAGTMIQDLTAAGLVEFTWDAKGTEVPFTFIPSNAEAREVTGVLEITPLDIGGDAKTRPTSEFSWACIGEPSFGAVTP